VHPRAYRRRRSRIRIPLPAPLTRLIGREAEVGAVRDALLVPEVRLLTQGGGPGTSAWATTRARRVLPVPGAQTTGARRGKSSRMSRITDLAEVFHVPVITHLGARLGICIGTVAHLTASIPNFLVMDYSPVSFLPANRLFK